MTFMKEFLEEFREALVLGLASFVEPRRFAAEYVSAKHYTALHLVSFAVVATTIFMIGGALGRTVHVDPFSPLTLAPMLLLVAVEFVVRSGLIHVAARLLRGAASLPQTVITYAFIGLVAVGLMGIGHAAYNLSEVNGIWPLVIVGPSVLAWVPLTVALAEVHAISRSRALGAIVLSSIVVGLLAAIATNISPRTWVAIDTLTPPMVREAKHIDECFLVGSSPQYWGDLILLGGAMLEPDPDLHMPSARELSLDATTAQTCLEGSVTTYTRTKVAKNEAETVVRSFLALAEDYPGTTMRDQLHAWRRCSEAMDDWEVRGCSTCAEQEGGVLVPRECGDYFEMDGNQFRGSINAHVARQIRYMQAIRTALSNW